MSIWDYLLWSYFVITPLYVIFTYKALKRRVMADPSIRVGLYWSSIGGLWIPMLLMLGYQSQNPDFAPSLRIIGPINDWWLAISVAIVCLIIYLGWSILSLNRNVDKSQSIVKSLEPIRWLLPATKKEMRRFVFAVSPSAGVCEEILYRGLLLGFLAEHMSVTNAVIISSLAFGAPHLYQGWSGFVKTALLGATMAIMTVLSESLILAIIFHTIIDMYAGVLGYLVFTRHNKQPPELKTNQAFTEDAQT